MTEKGMVVIVVSAPAGNEYRDRRKCSRIVAHFEQAGIDAEFMRDSNDMVWQEEDGTYKLYARDKECALAARAILAREYGLMTKIEGLA